TAGLRGVLGVGTNRMNIYTVGLASQAMAMWISNNGGGSVVIGYDSRLKSDVFARTCAAILAGMGVEVYLFDELVPVPVVSYAVRRLGCRAGVMITASHNPSKYNGFKAYGPDGYQMTEEDAHAVEQIMSGLDYFKDIRFGDYDALLADGKIKLVGSDFVEGYLDEVQKVCVNPEACKKAGLKVIYTPLCGAGNKPVRSVLSRIGIDDVTVVKVQEKPDGNFPYAPYPNPEIREAFTASLIVAANIPSDILLATDPDSDRVGIAVRRGDGYELMTGNEVGAIMVEYLLSQRKANGTLPANPVAVKSIVTSSLADKIAADYGCEMRNVLTGFKYIGEIVTDLEAAGEVDRFIMGYEESYGYLVGSHARDKDAVVASMMICEMASYFKLQGKSLLDVMEDIYEKYGYYKHRVIALEFDGEAGMKKMAAIMNDLRVAPPAEIAGASVVTSAIIRRTSAAISHRARLPQLTCPPATSSNSCSVITAHSSRVPRAPSRRSSSTSPQPRRMPHRPRHALPSLLRRCAR
ncbi:MAG: phospho-sugar mutase, partial [Clostridia bacterium]|nr:phospho-sugar mutase [Clostridia bacterium]